MTTLTTIGYGDLIPANTNERILAMIIMLVGVAMYSYVMGSFTEMIGNYDKNMGIEDKSSKLHNWIVLLNYFNKHKKKLDENIIKNIETHYNHFWKNNRNYLIAKKDAYFVTLPKSIKTKLIQYLWGDIIIQFSSFLLYFSHFSNKNESSKDYWENYKFYYDFSFLLMPRM